jgi:hypothetical protein
MRDKQQETSSKKLKRKDEIPNYDFSSLIYFISRLK